MGESIYSYSSAHIYHPAEGGSEPKAAEFFLDQVFCSLHILCLIFSPVIISSQNFFPKSIPWPSLGLAGNLVELPSYPKCSAFLCIAPLDYLPHAEFLRRISPITLRHSLYLTNSLLYLRNNTNQIPSLLTEFLTSVSMFCAGFPD